MATGPASEPVPGKLTPEEAARFEAHIRAKWNPLPECPFHPTVPTNWILNSTIAQIHGYAKNAALGVSGSTFPAVVVTCRVCGFMVPLNGLTTGILDRDTPESKPEDTAQPEAE